MGKEVQKSEGDGIEDVHKGDEGDVKESGERQGGTAAGKVAGVDIKVDDFLRARSVTFREKGPHIEMDCPECGGRNHTQTRRKRNSLKVNPDLGTFHCIVCQRKGGSPLKTVLAVPRCWFLCSPRLGCTKDTGS